MVTAALGTLTLRTPWLGAPVWLALCVAAFALCAAGPAWALDGELSAVIDRDRITIDQTVNLTIELPEGASGQLGTPEGTDFSVVSHSTSSQMSVRNGRRETHTSVTLMLRPTRNGTLTVGRVPVHLRTEVVYTQPFSVTVGDAPPPAGPAPNQGAVRPAQRAAPADETAGGPDSRVGPLAPLSDGLYFGPMPDVEAGEPFLVATITESEVFVGEQLVVDYVLFTPSNAFRMSGVELTEPEFANMWFMVVTDSRSPRSNGRLGSRRVGATIYDAQVLRSYALFPLRDGRAVVPEISLVVEMGGFGRAAGRRVVRSTPLELTVNPIPERDRPAGFRDGNVGSLRVTLNADRQSVRVGDSVNVTLAVSGSGLLSRVVVPQIPDVEGARLFPADESNNQDVGPDLWLRGAARRRVSLVPQREGNITIPPVRLNYFDPWTGTFQVAESESLEVQVSGTNPNALPVADAEAVDVNASWLAELPPEKPISSSTRGWMRAYRSPVYGVALAAPVVGYLFMLGAGAVRRRRAQSAPTRTRDEAARRAHEALKGADAGEIAKALRGYVTAIGDRPAGGMTCAALETYVAELSDATIAAQFAAAVNDAEVARYGGSPDVSALAAAAVAAVDALEATR